jgi:hypothetical protein
MTDDFIIRRKINQIEKHIEWMQKHLGESDALHKRLSEISRLRAELAHKSCLKLVKSYTE